MGNIRILYTDIEGVAAILVASNIQYIFEEKRMYAENWENTVELQMDKDDYFDVIAEAFINGKVDLRKYKEVSGSRYCGITDEDIYIHEDMSGINVENNNNDKKDNIILNLFKE